MELKDMPEGFKRAVDNKLREAWEQNPLKHEEEARICGTEQVFDDDLQGPCARCGINVFYRPWGTPSIPKICLSCAMIELKMTRDQLFSTIESNLAKGEVTIQKEK